MEWTGNFNKQFLPWFQVVSPVIYANSCGASSKIQHDKINMNHKFLEQKSRFCKMTEHVAIKKKAHGSATVLKTLQTNRQEKKDDF